MKILKKNCKFCNKPFNTYEINKEYCLDICKSRDSQKLKTPSAQERGIKILTIGELGRLWLKRKRQCNHCGEIYHVPNGTLNIVGEVAEEHFNPFFYCSANCQAASIFSNNQKVNKCTICGIEFKGSNTKFCSEECSYYYKRKNNLNLQIEKRKENLGKEKKKRKAISYEELNRRAEVNRLREEWEMLSKWKKY